MNQLKINEIYTSIQGESSFMGLPCIFIRTSGCKLRCVWCDTKYAYHDGEMMSLSNILEKVASFDISLVEVTGGEPMEQTEIYRLLNALLERGYTVLMETGGHIPLEHVNPEVHRIVDMKAPGSRMDKKNHYPNLELMTKRDEVKFVILDEADYIWSKDLIKKFNLEEKTNILLSPVSGKLNPQDLVAWMLKDKLKARFQLQLHKMIWDPEARSV